MTKFFEKPVIFLRASQHQRNILDPVYLKQSIPGDLKKGFITEAAVQVINKASVD
jgi:hypothetical protein